MVQNRPTSTADDQETKWRLYLQRKLAAIIKVRKVYFQPPATIKMEYPCIVYERSGGKTTFSDDCPYNFRRRYTVTVIDPDPDSIIPDLIAKEFKMCVADRTYSVDNLYHHVFTLYW